MTSFRIPSIPLLATAIVLWCSPLAEAGGASKKAHEHGVAQLSIAAEGQLVTLQFESPADEIYGFEHAPRNPGESEKQQAGLERLKSTASEMIRFDESLGCAFKERTAEVKMDGPKHSEVHAVFKVECGKSLKGTMISIDVSKNFPSIKRIRVQILGDSKQDAKVLRKKGSVQL